MVLSCDVLSFDPGDDSSSSLYLEEMMLEEATLTQGDLVEQYLFEGTADGWQFMGKIGNYDEPQSALAYGALGLSPNGSTNCFSFWSSPDTTVEDLKLYRARFRMGSDVSDADQAVQFRLRINQKGSWLAWERVVSSNNQQGPSMSLLKWYEVIIDPKVTESSDSVVQTAFDIMSFDVNDDESSWLYLDFMELHEVTISP
jgi:hypothetical protein